jgi:hypothetical protein
MLFYEGVPIIFIFISITKEELLVSVFPLRTYVRTYTHGAPGRTTPQKRPILKVPARRVRSITN